MLLIKSLKSENKKKYAIIFLRGMREQLMKAFPVIPCGQLHIAIWFITLQCAVLAQSPKQGSKHLLVIHDNVLIHSELIVHSGLQPI